VRLPDIPGPRDVLGLVDALTGAVPRLLALLDTADRVLADVDALLARLEATRVTAEGLLAETAAAQTRLVALLDALEPSLTRLQPTLDRIAETTDPREVDALVSLVDRLPVLAEQVERDVVPVMRTLSTVAPDLHDLLDVSRELNEMLAKLPGLRRLRRDDDD
jgi:ABC-type transporter Mla subunit MlaD